MFDNFAHLHQEGEEEERKTVQKAEHDASGRTKSGRWSDSGYSSLAEIPGIDETAASLVPDWLESVTATSDFTDLVQEEDYWVDAVHEPSQRYLNTFLSVPSRADGQNADRSWKSSSISSTNR
jgi:hypothetical protein